MLPRVSPKHWHWWIYSESEGLFAIAVCLYQKTCCAHDVPSQVMRCSFLSYRRQYLLQICHIGPPPTRVMVQGTLYINLEDPCWVLHSCTWCSCKTSARGVDAQDQNEEGKLWTKQIPLPSHSTLCVHLATSNSRWSQAWETTALKLILIQYSLLISLLEVFIYLFILF